MTELAVLVPVLNRPQNVKPLVESFLAGCPSDARMIFIMTMGDDAEAEAVKALTDDWVQIEQVTWPQKMAQALQYLDADWYLFAADDIRFTPGWWDATKELRQDERIGVIGTNDSRDGTGNPRVLSGDHTCHPLVRRSYIETRGTVDALVQAVHPGYHHWYVDDELVHTAKARHAWAYCRDAVIEHLHPYWRPDVQWDATYAQGEKHSAEDQALFESRIPLIQAEYVRCR